MNLIRFYKTYFISLKAAAAEDHENAYKGLPDTKQPKYIELGRHEMEVWYQSPYPEGRVGGRARCTRQRHVRRRSCAPGKGVATRWQGDGKGVARGWQGGGTRAGPGGRTDEAKVLASLPRLEHLFCSGSSNVQCGAVCGHAYSSECAHLFRSGFVPLTSNVDVLCGAVCGVCSVRVHVGVRRR